MVSGRLETLFPPPERGWSGMRRKCLPYWQISDLLCWIHTHLCSPHDREGMVGWKYKSGVIDSPCAAHSTQKFKISDWRFNTESFQITNKEQKVLPGRWSRWSSLGSWMQLESLDMTGSWGGQEGGGRRGRDNDSKRQRENRQDLKRTTMMCFLFGLFGCW